MNFEKFYLVLVLISSYSLCFIAVDRYRTIVTTTQEPWSINQALLLVVTSWITSGAASFPLFITQTLQPLVLENTTLCGYVSV